MKTPEFSNIHAHFRRPLAALEKSSLRDRLLRRIKWGLGAPYRVLVSSREARAVVRRRDRVSILRQLLESCWVVARYEFEPRDYYQYRLYDPQNWARRGQYITQRQNLRLLRGVLGLGALFWDKRDFSRDCEAQGLPAIPLLAEWRDGRLVSFVEDWPDEFYSKPALGYHGFGVRAWKNGSEVRSELERFIVDHGGGEGAVIQPRVLNHPDLSGLSNGSLCTLRITGCKMPDGEIEFLLPTFRMPVGDSSVDNFGQGNLVAPVDVKTGRLGMGRRRDEEGVIWSVESHPDTGQSVVGARVPFFEEALALCRRAHQAFPDPPMLGWDVALSKEGPLLVEGNYLFGSEAPQIAHDSPLGEPRYITCMSSLLEGAG